MIGAAVTGRDLSHDPSPERADDADLGLDAQELAILRLLADGLVLDGIARRLSLSERTVRRRLRALCDRFGVDAPVQVVVLAARHGVL